MTEAVVTGAFTCLDCAWIGIDTAIYGDIYLGGYKPVVSKELELDVETHHEATRPSSLSNPHGHSNFILQLPMPDPTIQVSMEFHAGGELTPTSIPRYIERK